MKKLLVIALILVMCISLCACGGGDVAGTYKSVLWDTSYQLNDNNTYDKTSPKDSGTYETKGSGFALESKDGIVEEEFSKEGDYYYRTNLICCFEEDEAYGIAPAFNDEGKTDQDFVAYYDTIDSSTYQYDVLILQLESDGTFKLRDCERRGYHQSEGTLYEGTYSLDGKNLNLNCDNGKTIPFLYINDCIYFDILTKQ
ncbi:MAG: hypothetical protein IJP00_02625 [Firmicutes bacterium]|nr:hypothetical protein [Bacillota bacterium]